MTRTKQTKRVKIIDEAPIFKRVECAGIGEPKVDRKKTHTNTKPKPEKKIVKQVNKNELKALKSRVVKLQYKGYRLDSTLDKLTTAVSKYDKSNNKENTRSLEYNLDEIVYNCNKAIELAEELKKKCFEMQNKYINE